MSTLDLAALELELQEAVLPVLSGPSNERLWKTIRRVVEARLRRHVGPDLRGYAVRVGPDATGDGVEVAVELQSHDRVQTLRLRSERI